MPFLAPLLGFLLAFYRLGVALALCKRRARNIAMLRMEAFPLAVVVRWAFIRGHR